MRLSKQKKDVKWFSGFPVKTQWPVIYRMLATLKEDARNDTSITVMEDADAWIEPLRTMVSLGD